MGAALLSFTRAFLPKRKFLIAVFCLGLTACGSGDTEPVTDMFTEDPVDLLYNDAHDLMTDGQYERAATAFDEVERQHPYSIWATKAQLMAAYSHYQDNAYDEALIALDRFIELHPANRDAPYAYYLRALSYYEQISDVRRDQKMTRLALDALQDVTRRFPETSYARDAKLKADLTVDHLAGKEMTIGRYYQRSANYAAAIERFNNVVENYGTTTHVPEALQRLVESYLALGLQAEAERSAAVLGHNFPGDEWYQDSYALLSGTEPTEPAEEKSWYQSAYNWVFGS